MATPRSAVNRDLPGLSVGILAYEGCMTSEVLGVAEVVQVGIRVAGVGAPHVRGQVDVRVMTARPSLKVAVAPGVQLDVAPARRCDVLIVPGFKAGVDAHEVEALVRRLSPEIDFVREQFQTGTQLVSVCLGAFLLAEAGVLNDRVATTSWLHAPLFRDRYPRARLSGELLVVRDRGVTTTAAFSAMYDFSLQLLREQFGALAADRTAAILLLDAARDRQSPYVDEELLASTATTFGANVQRWLRRNLHEPFDLAVTAAQFAVSPRTLTRRFAQDTGTTPLKYLQEQRLSLAKHLLASTSQSVSDVTKRVGYRDPAAFSQLFKRQVGLAPRDYRAQFASRSG